MCHLLEMKAEFPFQENPQNISNNIPNSWEPLDHTHSECLNGSWQKRMHLSIKKI